jgi:hypothetical protein
MMPMGGSRPGCLRMSQELDAMPTILAHSKSRCTKLFSIAASGNFLAVLTVLAMAYDFR